MRRHDARKWLHAILDLLPVILIPVFMIYSHRHTIDSYTLDVPQNKAVDFNQLLVEDGSSSYQDYTLKYNGDNFSGFQVGTGLSLTLQESHIYYLKTNVVKSVNSSGYFLFYNSQQYYQIFDTYTFTCVKTLNYSFSRSFSATSDTTLRDYECNLNLFDLTRMFGSGNEPTATQFNNWYPNDYYDYTLSHKELLKDYETITYNDTDILSQFTYNLYNSVDKYFNMNNVFGLTSVYDWFNLNIFNGNAPLYIYIIWNIVLYEFVMDLLMLLYALFMWFIDFCQDLIDRCFTTSKGGKH